MLNNNCDREKAFAATQKSGPQEFSRKLRDVVKGCGDNQFKSKHLVFLDKNHPKEAIGKVISEISQSLPGNVKAKFLYLIPLVNASVLELPFSFQFML